MPGNVLNNIYPGTGVPSERLALATIGDRAVFDVRDFDAVHVQATLANASGFGTGVVTLTRSLDGRSFVALSSPVTIAAEGVVSVADITDAVYLAATVTTAAGSAVLLDLTVKGWQQP